MSFAGAISVSQRPSVSSAGKNESAGEDQTGVVGDPAATHAYLYQGRALALLLIGLGGAAFALSGRGIGIPIGVLFILAALFQELRGRLAEPMVARADGLLLQRRDLLVPWEHVEAIGFGAAPRPGKKPREYSGAATSYPKGILRLSSSASCRGTATREGSSPWSEMSARLGAPCVACATSCRQTTSIIRRCNFGSRRPGREELVLDQLLSTRGRARRRRRPWARARASTRWSSPSFAHGPIASSSCLPPTPRPRTRRRAAGTCSPTPLPR